MSKHSMFDWIKTKAGKKTNIEEQMAKPTRKLISQEVPAAIVEPENIIKIGAELRAKLTDSIVKDTLKFSVAVEPVGAPRMTKRDKWLSPRRKPVQRYFDYRDALRSAISSQNNGEVPPVPDCMILHFFISMPDSWSKKKKIEMDGKPHRQRPDRDNLDKAVGDALFSEDGGIWSGSQEKRWCKSGDERIEMTFVYA